MPKVVADDASHPKKPSHQQKDRHNGDRWEYEPSIDTITKYTGILGYVVQGISRDVALRIKNPQENKPHISGEIKCVLDVYIRSEKYPVPAQTLMGYENKLRTVFNNAVEESKNSFALDGGDNEIKLDFAERASWDVRLYNPDAEPVPINAARVLDEGFTIFEDDIFHTKRGLDKGRSDDEGNPKTSLPNKKARMMEDGVHMFHIEVMASIFREDMLEVERNAVQGDHEKVSTGSKVFQSKVVFRDFENQTEEFKIPNFLSIVKSFLRSGSPIIRTVPNSNWQEYKTIHSDDVLKDADNDLSMRMRKKTVKDASTAGNAKWKKNGPKTHANQPEPVHTDDSESASVIMDMHNDSARAQMRKKDKGIFNSQHQHQKINYRNARGKSWSPPKMNHHFHAKMNHFGGKNQRRNMNQSSPSSRARMRQKTPQNIPNVHWQQPFPSPGSYAAGRGQLSYKPNQQQGNVQRPRNWKQHANKSQHQNRPYASLAYGRWDRGAQRQNSQFTGDMMLPHHRDMDTGLRYTNHNWRDERPGSWHGDDAQFGNYRQFEPEVQYQRLVDAPEWSP